MLITRPYSCESIRSPAARQARYTPVRFASITRRHSAGVISVRGFANGRSCAFTRTSSFPNSKTARSMAARTSASSAASMAWANPLRLSAQTSFAQEFAATSSRCKRVLVVTPTLAPASASATAAARPSEFEAPITSAFFPASENSSVTLIPTSLFPPRLPTSLFLLPPPAAPPAQTPSARARRRARRRPAR